MNRKLSTHLLTLADNDDFQTSLHILLTTPPSQINLNRQTSFGSGGGDGGGDYLVTLSAYAACETTSNMQTRINALKCLVFVLDKDFTAVNKVAGDGGSALHCALAAAASSFDEETYNDDDDDDDDGDDNEDDHHSSCSESEESSVCDSEYDDDDDSIGVEDKAYLNELKSRAADETSITDNYYPEYSSLSNEGIILMTIQLLLSNESDVNLPLANILNISENTTDLGGSECDDDECGELAYAREAVVQQWTPLMFALQMVLLATKKRRRRKSVNNDMALSMSLLIVKLLLGAGADATYIAAGTDQSYSCDEIYNWNALHIVATSSHILNSITIESNVVELINKMNQGSAKILHSIDQGQGQGTTNVIINVDDIIQGMTVYDCLQGILATEIKDRNIRLTPLQQFTIAIMTKDVQSALSVLERTSQDEQIEKDDLLRKWRLVKYSSIFPLSTVWDKETFQTKTLLNIAAFCNALDSVRLLLGGDLAIISEVEIRNSIQCVFMNYNDDTCTNLNGYQVSVLLILLGMDKSDDGIEDHSLNEKRQRVLDRLLMESCGRIPWAQNSPASTLTLLTLGADPNVASIANEVMDSLSPLHLVAGNYRGFDGVEKINYLLGKRTEVDFLETPKSVEYSANLYARTTGTDELPLHFALRKKNFHVVKRLFEAMSDGDFEMYSLIEWDIEKATLLGEAAIGCASEVLFESAVNILRTISSHCKDEHCRELSRCLGKLLLWAVDERSGFGSKRSSQHDEGRGLKLKRIVDIISAAQADIHEISISPWARDEISGHTPLHLILRNDRGMTLRTSLLPSLCAIMLKDNSKLDFSSNFISLPSSHKFGMYTALHLACALGCEQSVKILLGYDADPHTQSGDGETPADLIPKGRGFSKDIMAKLQQR